MEKHFLATASEKKSALYGIQFLGYFFSKKKEIKITLFYTAPRPPAVWEGERSLEMAAERELQAKEYERKGRDALETAKRELIKLGFGKDQVSTKFQVRRFSKVEDIIREGAQGLYDGVILGRRGLSLLEAAFDESVTIDFLKQKVNFPVWICRMPDRSRKNILVCVDGSEASYRVADHVGFVMADETGQEVTLLAVRRPGGKMKDNPEDVLSKSKEYLLANGFPPERAMTKVIDARNVADAILKEADQGKFAAVATGRTGAGQGFLKKIFIGSVSDTLFRELTGAALWIYQ